MGRYIFWRKAVISLSTLLILNSTIVFAEFIPPSRNMPVKKVKREIDAGALKSVQGHKGLEIYSIPIPQHRDIDKYFDTILTQHVDWIEKGLDQIKNFRLIMVEEIKKQNLPLELQFLPMIESSYEVNAVSHSGAVGMWQFMKNTADPLGLQINRWVDERRDFWVSTQAALIKIKENYEWFGDWCLALAAYNCGLGCLQKIINQRGIKDFWLLKEKGYLPEETAKYVPKFFAVVKILSYPGRYGFEFDWEQSLDWEKINLNYSIDLEILAEKSGIPYKILKMGNAGLNFNVTPPQSFGYELNVPVQYIQNVKYSIYESKSNLERFQIHTIRSGDTLYDLARHYETKIDLIHLYNPGLEPRKLKPGTKLLIPLESIDTAAPPAYKTHEDLNFDDIYTVEKGDSLWKIAQKYNIVFIKGIIFL